MVIPYCSDWHPKLYVKTLKTFSWGNAMSRKLKGKLLYYCNFVRSCNGKVFETLLGAELF